VRDSEGEAVALPKVKVADAPEIDYSIVFKMLPVENNFFRYCI